MGVFSAIAQGGLNQAAASREWTRSKIAATTAYERSKESVLQQQNYQTRMSNSAYQRATQDLEKAGLNRILAYTQGGASSPQGAAAQAPPAKAPTVRHKVDFDLLNMGEQMARIKGVNAQTGLTNEKQKGEEFRNVREGLMSDLWEQVTRAAHTAMGAAEAIAKPPPKAKYELDTSKGKPFQHHKTKGKGKRRWEWEPRSQFQPWKGERDYENNRTGYWRTD